jgi:hypothetical protein
MVKLDDVEAMLLRVARHGYKVDRHTLALVKACLPDLPIYPAASSALPHVEREGSPDCKT